jgi:hypothetical protein
LKKDTAMDISTFYALLSGTCFTLVGLWWNVVQSRKDWLASPEMRELASGVYLSFLIPGLMSLVAQIGVGNSLVWQAAFFFAAIMGLIYTNRIIARTRKASLAGSYHKNRWGVNVIYFFILIVSMFPGLGFLFGGGLQTEAILISGLILIGHGLTWEFLTQPPEIKPEG